MEFDYIVVGAGAAGCVVAGRLAAAERRPSVLLVEYGGPARNPLLHIPKGFYYTLRGDRYLYRYADTAGRPGGKHEVWLRGRVLGGSAAVNGMMWMRGAPADWDGLAARGNPGWSWADMLPAYQAMEDHSLGASETRGAGGPLGISVTDTSDEMTSAILESAVRYGWRYVADANADDTERIGFTPSTISHGRRTTSYDAFVRPVLGTAKRRPPGEALHRRHPYPRHLADPRWSPSHRRKDDRRRGTVSDVTAGREVILCAGTVETPLLLERSGIGNPELLRKHGIELRAESPNVGERLIEQRGAALQVTLKNDSGAGQQPDHQNGPGKRSAPLAGNRQGHAGDRRLQPGLPVQVGASRTTPRPAGPVRPHGPRHGEQGHEAGPSPGHPLHGLPDPPGDSELGPHLGQRPGTTPWSSTPVSLRPGATGTRSPRSWKSPAPSSPRTPVAAQNRGRGVPWSFSRDRQDTIQYSYDTGTGIYHAVGSAAMGPGEDNVVDAQLKVRGVTGLRIADASVLPLQVSGNTAAPAMLVGYRAADLILSDF